MLEIASGSWHGYVQPLFHRRCLPSLFLFSFPLLLFLSLSLSPSLSLSSSTPSVSSTRGIPPSLLLVLCLSRDRRTFFLFFFNFSLRRITMLKEWRWIYVSLKSTFKRARQITVTSDAIVPRFSRRACGKNRTQYVPP